MSVTVPRFTTARKNNNKHTKNGMRLLQESMQENGFLTPITVAADGESVDGAARLETVAEIFPDVEPIVIEHDGTRPIIAVRTDLATANDPRARRLALLANRVAELNLDYDIDVLLEDARNGIDLDALGFDENALKELLQKANADSVGELLDDEQAVDRADELQAKWKVQLGDLWQLGEHRIMCGDCTDVATLARLMQGEKAAICWTDPPWNVAYGTSDNPKWKKRSIKNDALGERFGDFAAAFCAEIANNLVPGGLLYMAMSAQEWGTITNTLEAANFHWSSTIIWNKDHPVLSRKDYHTKYEPVWYGWLASGPRVVEVVDRKQSDVWDINRPTRSDDHPTMKPIELVARALVNSSIPGALVFEPFSGSGTTIVAAENTGRRCFAVELEEKYVAVALERWSKVSGKQPALLERVELADGYGQAWAMRTGQVDERQEKTKYDVPDAIWPTDNDWGVPLLMIDKQGDALDLPVVKWGTKPRGSKHAGTYHFYTDDYKFNALWDDPTPVINSGCPSVVEINFSLSDMTPRAKALELIYRKRWLARYWQESGVRIFVDLGVPPAFLDIATLGVPVGWRAFSTRIYVKDQAESDLAAQYTAAKAIRGNDDMLFVVFGGNESIRKLCIEKRWIHVPEHLGAFWKSGTVEISSEMITDGRNVE